MSQPIIVKTLRIPLGIMAKVEQVRGDTSFNAYCVEALREKAEREAIPSLGSVPCDTGTAHNS